MKPVSEGSTSRNTVGVWKGFVHLCRAIISGSTVMCMARWNPWREILVFSSCHTAILLVWTSSLRSSKIDTMMMRFFFAAMALHGTKLEHFWFRRIYTCFIFHRILRKWTPLSRSGKNCEKWASIMKSLLLLKKSLIGSAIPLTRCPPSLSTALPHVPGLLNVLIRN